MSDTNSRLRAIVRSGGILFFGLAFELGISFVGQVVIARYLGSVGYGAISIGATILSVASIITLVGLNTGVAQFLPRATTDRERRGIVRSAFQIALGVGTGLAVLLFVFADVVATSVFNDPSTAGTVRIFAAAIPFAVAMKLSLGVTQGLKRTVPKLVFKYISYPLSRIIFIAVVAGLGLGVLEGSLAYAIPHVLVGIALVVYLFLRSDVFQRGSWEPKHRELLAFSAPLLVSTTMGQVLNNVDIFLLGISAASTGAIGVYNAVYGLARLLNASSSAFGFLFLPMLSELYDDDETDEMRTLVHVTTKWMILGTIPLFVLFALFSRPVVTLVYSAEYASGSISLAVLATGFFMPIALGLNSGALTAVGRTRALMKIDIVAAVVNVVLNLVLIPHYSILGAAIATAVSFVLMNVLYSAVLYRETGILPFSSTTRRLVVISAFLVVATALVDRFFLPPGGVAQIVLYLLFVIAYGFSVLRFGGVEPAEVMIVKSVEERFDVDLGPIKWVAHRIMDE